jgi:hypothetical protein
MPNISYTLTKGATKPETGQRKISCFAALRTVGETWNTFPVRLGKSVWVGQQVLSLPHGCCSQAERNLSWT